MNYSMIPTEIKVSNPFGKVSTIIKSDIDTRKSLLDQRPKYKVSEQNRLRFSHMGHRKNPEMFQNHLNRSTQKTHSSTLLDERKLCYLKT